MDMRKNIQNCRFLFFKFLNNKWLVGIFWLLNTALVAQIPIVDNKIIITNEAKVNSENLEYSPAFYKDGIVFISTQSKGVGFKVKDKNLGTHLMNIYQAKRDEAGYLEKPTPFANELIARVHEGPLTFNSTGSTVFFTRNEKKIAATDGLRKLQIFQAELINGEWQKIKKLGFNQTEYNFTHPSISVENDVLYFASDMPGGEGGLDLYKSLKEGDTWGEPINLGKRINTPGNEIFPFIHADGTLYFASNDHSTIGGLDIFYMQLGDDAFPYPINLGAPFNSENDDFGFIVDLDNKNGYYSSSRPKGLGGDDLYSFNLIGDMEDRFAKNNKKKEETITLIDEDGDPLIDAEINYAKMDNLVVGNGIELRSDGQGGFVISGGVRTLEESEMTDEDGQATLNLENGNYIVSIQKPGYIPQQIMVTPETDLSQLAIELKKAEDCVAIAGRVLLTTTNPIIGAEVKAINTETGIIEKGYSDGNGNFNFCLPCNATYTLFAIKNEITTAPQIISTKDMDCDSEETLRAVLSLPGSGTPPVAGTIIRLPNIYFNFDDYTLRPDAQYDLELVINMLQSHPDMRVELAAHTDARGSQIYNLELSQLRSESVLKYLVKNGINVERLFPKGYGERDIRNRCKDFVKCPEAEHQVNRRTEIRILGLNETPMTINPPNDDPDNLFFLEEEKEEEDFFPKELPERAFLNQSPKNVETSAGLKINESRAKEIMDFMVVAGTFKIYDNAQKRANQLKQLGFTNTTIIQKEQVDVQMVVVHQTNSKTDAMSLSQKIWKENKIQAYVRAMNN